VNKTPNAAPAPVDGMVLVSGELLREIADEMRANADSDAGAGRLSRLTLMWAHGLETLIAAAPTSAATPGGQGDAMPHWRSPDGRILSEEAVRFDGIDTTGWQRWPWHAPIAPGAVDALPAKWRGEAFDIAGQRGPGDEMAQAFQVCADELTAALAHPQPDGPRAGGEP
jgi:hypothetical protein